MKKKISKTQLKETPQQKIVLPKNLIHHSKLVLKGLIPSLHELNILAQKEYSITTAFTNHGNFIHLIRDGQDTFNEELKDYKKFEEKINDYIHFAYFDCPKKKAEEYLRYKHETRTTKFLPVISEKMDYFNQLYLELKWPEKK